MADEEKELEAKKEEVDCSEVEEEPLEQEEKATLTLEAPMVVSEPISLKSSSNDILDKISQASTVEELREFTQLFHLSLAKKEASRALTQSELLDVILEQASDRITKRPGDLSNKDLLDYMNVFQASLDKTSKTLDDKIVEASPVTLNQTNQEININLGDSSMTISDESRARILDVLNAITKNSSQKTLKQASEEVEHVEADKKENNND